MPNQAANRKASRGHFRVEFDGVLVFGGPVHIGTGDRLDVATDAPILRYPSIDNQFVSGRPVLPGSSIRGVIADWCQREAELLGVSPDAFDRLFGSTHVDVDRQGRLTVLDASLAASRDIRDHVKLNPEWGAAAGRGKFDHELALVETAVLRFIYEGDSAGDDELILLRAAVTAMQDGLLFFGAKGAWGFGRATLEQPQWRVVDRSATNVLSGWLLQRLDQTYTMQVASPEWPQTKSHVAHKAGRSQPPKPWSWLSLVVDLRFDGPMLTAGPYDEAVRQADEAQAKAVYATDLNGRPILPGSSLRGVMSAHGKRILKSLRSRNSNVTRDLEDVDQALFGFVDEDAPDDVPNARRSLLHVGEGRLVDQAGEEISMAPDRDRVVLNHVAIDRVTGFAVDGKLFSAVALASPRFRTRLLVRWNAGNELHEAGVALLLFVLRDMRERLLWVGSRTTRGYGHLKDVTVAETRLSIVRAEPGATPTRHFEGDAPKDLLGIAGKMPECVKAWRTLVENVA